jgi:hypothetical protein
MDRKVSRVDSSLKGSGFSCICIKDHRYPQNTTFKRYFTLNFRFRAAVSST